MEVGIVRINKANYYLFDELVFYRINSSRRNEEENMQPLNFSGCFEALDNSNLYVFAAEFNNEFVGWISINYLPKIGRTNGKGYLFIDELWVDSAFRNRGIAKSLMYKADEVANTLSCLGTRLYVSADNESAIRLYEKCGYTNKRKTYYMDKEYKIS